MLHLGFGYSVILLNNYGLFMQEKSLFADSRYFADTEALNNYALIMQEKSLFR